MTRTLIPGYDLPIPLKPPKTERSALSCVPLVGLGLLEVDPPGLPLLRN